MAAPDDQWWVINGADLHVALRACRDGTDPDIQYLELLANSETEDYREDR